jgi:exosortase/archaeosortase family protein
MVCAMSVFILYQYIFMLAATKNKWVKDPANLFVLNMVVVYAAWKAFSFYVKHSSGFMHTAWIKFIISLGAIYANVTSLVLNILGERTVHNGIEIFYPVQNKIIRVEDHCLAIPATVIFVGTIALFRGNWKDKIWFIPMGIFFIAVINILRLIFVCETFVYFTKRFFEINHTVIYVVITYALIFILIIWWMKKFAGQKK